MKRPIEWVAEGGYSRAEWKQIRLAMAHDGREHDRCDHQVIEMVIHQIMVITSRINLITLGRVNAIGHDASRRRPTARTTSHPPPRHEISFANPLDRV
jgi:hypothetical protein